MMTNLLPGGLSLERLASIPRLLGVLGSCITKSIFDGTCQFQNSLGKGKPEPYLGSRRTFWIFLPEEETEQVPERGGQGIWGPASRGRVQKELLLKGTLCPPIPVSRVRMNLPDKSPLSPSSTLKVCLGLPPNQSPKSASSISGPHT